MSQDTGFYYLQSRYYDPAIGRFINADSLVSTGQGLLGYNMFAYCRNNPVCRIDISGREDMECTDLDANNFTDDEDLMGGGNPGSGSTTGSNADINGGGGSGISSSGPSTTGSNGGSLSGGSSPKFTPDQQALIQLAKDSKRGGVTMEEAEILVGWAKEYGISFHEPMIHENRSGIWSYTMHIKIFNIHIMVNLS